MGAAMRRFRRFGRPLTYLLVVWLGATANFLLPRLLPGDPIEVLIGEESIRLTAEQRATVLAQYGLDRPLLAQYGAYWAGLARLDLGTSVTYGAPVRTLVAARLPWTLLLLGSAIVLATLLGFALACLFHWTKSRRASSTLMGGVMVLTSLPPFWLGMVAIAVFAVQLGWLPSHGATTAGAATGAGDVLRHALLPLATLTLSYLAAPFLVARAGLEDALGAGYVALARSHGAGPLRVLLRQAAPNAALPLLNQLAVSFGALLGGTVVVETVFAYPGLGSLLYEGILAHDFPLVQGVFLLLVISVVLANVVADLFEVAFDPRLRGRRDANR